MNRVSMMLTVAGPILAVLASIAACILATALAGMA